AGEAAGLLHEGTAHLVLSDLDPSLLTHLAENQAQPHPPLGDLAVLLLRLLLGLALVLERTAGLLEPLRHLAPNGLELPLDQGWRQVEAVPLLQLVKKRTFHLGTGGLIVLALDLLRHQLAQLLQILGTQVLREHVVDLRPLGDRDLLPLDVERRILAGQRFLRVIVRELGGDRTLLAGLDALKPVLKSRDESPLPEDNVHTLAGTALERLAVNLPDEVDRYTIAVLGSPTLGGLEGGAAFDELTDGVLDSLVVHIGDRALELQLREIDQIDLRQHLERHVEREICLT